MVPLSVEYSQRTTVPVWPDRVHVPLLLPEHTDVLPVTAPPTEPAFTDTLVVLLAVQPPVPVTVTVYIPLFTAVAPEMVGFCCVDVKLLGPVQLYDTPPPANRFRSEPWQTGLLLDAVATTVVFTATLVVVVAEHPAALVTVRV